MHRASRRWVLQHGLLGGVGLLVLPQRWGGDPSVLAGRGRSTAIPQAEPEPEASPGRGPAREPEGPPPWAALSPYTQGASLPLGWRLASLSPVVAGSALLTLRHASGREEVVRLARRGPTPIGVAQTPSLDLLLVNGGKGRVPTDETVARVVLALAAVVAEHETAGSRAATALRPLGPSHC